MEVIEVIVLLYKKHSYISFLCFSLAFSFFRKRCHFAKNPTEVLVERNEG
jgi:hypothetical protein